MCMINSADGCVTPLGRAERTARKDHRCSECERAIAAGERYLDERHIWEGELCQHRTCQHCRVVRDWLENECGGWVYGGVAEDMHEHAAEAGYGMRVKMLSVGIRRRWVRKDGRMWPVPRLPKTTHEVVRPGGGQS